MKDQNVKAELDNNTMLEDPFQQDSSDFPNSLAVADARVKPVSLDELLRIILEVFTHEVHVRAQVLNKPIRKKLKK